MLRPCVCEEANEKANQETKELKGDPQREPIVFSLEKGSRGFNWEVPTDLNEQNHVKGEVYKVGETEPLHSRTEQSEVAFSDQVKWKRLRSKNRECKHEVLVVVSSSSLVSSLVVISFSPLIVLPLIF